MARADCKKPEVKRKLADLPDVLDVVELMQALGISRSLAYESLRDGTIPSVKLGDRWLIRKVDVEAFLRQRPSTQSVATKTRARRVERILRDRLEENTQSG